MRKENVSITERDLMFAVGGQLFSQAPKRQPRKVEIIMTKVRDNFREIAHNSNEFYSLSVDAEEFNKFIKDFLFAIPEFKELNLSQIEFENNVDVDDESRPKYVFGSRYDKEDSETWKRDFIDLDAFVGNVLCTLSMIDMFNIDCGCCIHGDTDKCTTCYINSKFKDHYEGSRHPKGKHTFACKYDCYRGYYICCEECNRECDKRCDSKSNECNQAINRIEVKDGGDTNE